jgi:hypothetical protein
MQLFADGAHLRPRQARENLQDRQLDFLDAEIVLSGPVFTVESPRIDYGEQRFQTVGFLAGRMVMVVDPARRSRARDVDEKMQ